MDIPINAVRDYINTHADILPHVPKARVFMGPPAQGTEYPFITLSQVGARVRNGYTSWVTRVQISIFDTSVGRCQMIAEKVAQAVEDTPLSTGFYAAYAEIQGEMPEVDVGVVQIPVDGLFYYNGRTEFRNNNPVEPEEMEE